MDEKTLPSSSSISSSDSSPTNFASSADEKKVSTHVVDVEKKVEPSIPRRSPYRIKLIMLALCVSTFVVALDTFIISTALPVLVADLSASNAEYAWMVSSLLLARAVTMPIWGKTSDIFGRKPTFILSNFIFLVGAVVGAVASNAGVLIVGRVLQGLGSGGVLVLGSVCVGDIFSTRQRGTYLGIIGVVYAVTASAGPVIGGALVQTISWRWCFWINVPLVVIALILLILLLDIKSPQTPFWDGVKAIDWLGNAFFTIGTLMALIPLQIGGVIVPWKSPQVLCPLLMSPLALGLFALVEKKFATHPIMPFRLFNGVSKASISIINVAQSLLTTGSTFFLPLYFQIVLGASPLNSGLYYLPSALVLSIFFICTGHIISKTGEYVLLIRLSFLPLCLGAGLLIDSKAEINWPLIIVPQILLSIGLGLYQAPLVAFHAHLDKSDMAVGTATFSFVKTFFQMLSIVIGQIIFQANMNTNSDKALQSGVSNDLLSALVGGKTVAAVSTIKQLPAIQQLNIRSLLNLGIRDIWIFYTVMGVLGFAASFALRKVELEDDEK